MKRIFTRFGGETMPFFSGCGDSGYNRRADLSGCRCVQQTL